MTEDKVSIKNMKRRGRTWLRLRGASIACAIVVAAGTAALWAHSPKPPAKAAPQAPKAAGKLTVQRLTASLLARTDLGTAAPSEWGEPPVLRSEDGHLDTTLTVAYAENVLKIGDQSQRLRLRSYNGMLTGPTLRIKAGDIVNVKLKNDLPEEPAMEMKGGECSTPMHGFNITNLHTHGLHISPSGKSDDVLRTVNPQKSWDYEFKILPAGNPDKSPARQYPGTFWYHAHNHGSTAMQLASGMAGAILVEDGPADVVPEVQAAKERLFIFQQFAYKVNDKGVGEVEKFTDLSSNWSTLKKRTTINGRMKPRFSMRPGEIERWRLIDSGIFTDLPISIASVSAGTFDMRRIASDGITLPRPERANRIELGPGNRMDLLVKAPQEKGVHYLFKNQSTQFPLPGTNEAPTIADEQILAEIEVTGEPCSAQNPCATKFPDQLRPPTDMLPDIKASEVNQPKVVAVKFGRRDGFFNINGTCFNRDVVLPEFDKRLGNVEEWEIVNDSPAPHPFHIHVNAFQLLDTAGNPGEWRDTILVPANDRIRFRTRFERFDGEFVLHCHILTHEDSGMMQLVRVKPKS